MKGRIKTCRKYSIRRMENGRPRVQNGNSRLAENQVRDIAFDYITPVFELARRYGVSVWTIRRIRKGETYKNIR